MMTKNNEKIKISKEALEELEKIMGFRYSESEKIIIESLKFIDAQEKNEN